MSLIKTALAAGREAQRTERAEEEKTKLGLLRGGNAGAIIDGRVYGKCHRLSHLRTLGIEAEIPANTYIMFAAGYANEDIVFKELAAAGVDIRNFDENPLKHTLPSGAEVSFRPDGVVFEQDKPVLGLELKLCSSMYTCKDVHYALKPKRDHLIQAAWYSCAVAKTWNLPEPLPFSLVYVNRAQWHVRMLARGFKAMLANCGWDLDFKGEEPFKILPFEREYELTWTQDGYLQYQTEGLPEPIVTQLTEQSIVNYYEEVAAIAEHKDLGPRPTRRDPVEGSSSFKPCDYCDFSRVCDEREGNYDEWLAAAKNQ